MCIRDRAEIMPNKESLSKYTGYLQANNTSRFKKQKIYHKEQELLSELEKARKARSNDKVNILGDPRLLEFVRGRIRMEASLSAQALEYHGIPLLLRKFMHFSQAFKQEKGETLCSHLHKITFKKMYKALEGKTVNKIDDGKIRSIIEAKYLIYKENGKVCRRRANALIRYYRAIKTEGWETLKKESEPTYYRNLKLLNNAGISTSIIKSCHLGDAAASDSTNIGELLSIDYDKQRPEWYKEPEAKVTSLHTAKASPMDGLNDNFMGDAVIYRPRFKAKN